MAEYVEKLRQQMRAYAHERIAEGGLDFEIPDDEPDDMEETAAGFLSESTWDSETIDEFKDLPEEVIAQILSEDPDGLVDDMVKAAVWDALTEKLSSDLLAEIREATLAKRREELNQGLRP